MQVLDAHGEPDVSMDYLVTFVPPMDLIFSNIHIRIHFVNTRHVRV
jgi:hypothetical protein